MADHIIGVQRKPGEEREENDYYATHPGAIPPLMKLLGWENGGKLIRESSCGAGNLSQMLELYGHNVISTDLIDRGYGITGVDYLKYHPLDEMPYDAVIQNPPYKLAQEFIEKSLKIAPLVCSFLKLQFLESEKRRKFFDEFPPRYVAVFRERMPSSKYGLFPKKESSTVCYAWFIWERGFTGRPEILWI